MGEQMGLERPGEQLLGTSEVGVLCKGSKGRIILNNNYSYCLLSTYYLPKTVQSAFCTFSL